MRSPRVRAARPARVRPLARVGGGGWGQHQLTITGGIGIGSAAPGFGATQNLAAARYGLMVEELTPAEIMARWPGFHVPDGYREIYDPHTGFVLPEPCVAAHLDLAAKHGAALQHSEHVRRWSPDGAGVRVEPDTAMYTAESLVITATP